MTAYTGNMKRFPLPDGRIVITPSVLSADFADLRKSLAPVNGKSGWITFYLYAFSCNKSKKAEIIRVSRLNTFFYYFVYNRSFYGNCTAR